MPPDPPIFRQSLALGLVSASVISLQLALMLYFSNTQWNHFAFMVISIALLGFGASGTAVSIFRGWITQRRQAVVAVSMLLCAGFMAVCIPLCQHPFFRFDSLLIFARPAHALRLGATCVILFAPFFFSGLAIGLMLIQHIDKIGRLYFINLIGSGAGGAASLLLFWFLPPPLLPAALSLLPLMAALVFCRHRWRFYGVSLLVLILTLVQFANPPGLLTSEFKSLSKTLQLPGAVVTHAQPTPFGYIEVVTSPALRYAPGLSLQYRKTIPAVDAVFVNGEWMGPVPNTVGPENRHIYDYTPLALAYRMGDPQTILSLSSGTGALITQAVTHNPAQVTAVENNPVIAALLNALYATRSPYASALVETKPVSDITYLLTSGRHYDLILIPTIDAFGGTAGLYALNEQYHLTLDAFEMMWDRLSDNGMISVSTWMDYPVRAPLRVLSTLVSVLESKGVDRFHHHIVAVRSWNMIAFVMKKSAVTADETEAIRAFALEMNFDPVLLKDINDPERSRFNSLPDQDFFTLTDDIMAGNGDELIRRYAFNINPATLNRPYFSQYLKLGHLLHLREFFTASSIPFIELGYLLLILTFIQVCLLSLALILLPLMVRKWRGSHKPWTAAYFSSIGIGFMFIEIVMIQQFILYFGTPLYAAAIVISAILVFSGLGSLITSALKSSVRAISVSLLLIALMTVLYVFCLPPLLRHTIGFSPFFKIILAIIMIAPLSLLMGVPFPLGLRMADQTNPKNISWAWSINGLSAVISAVLAAIIAIELGFAAVMSAAACLYGTACLATLLSALWRFDG